jgi:arylformamidase
VGFLALMSCGALILSCAGANEGPEAIPGGATSRDVSYDPTAPGDPLRQLDVYSPPRANGKLAPVVVWVHGGGWQSGDKRNALEDKVRFFNGAGYVFVSTNYRLSPEPETSPSPTRVKHPIHAEDVARAIDFVVRHAADYGGDASRLALLGHSAGAHLVALVGTDETLLGAHGLTRAQIKCVGSLDTEGYDVARVLQTGSEEQKVLFTNAFGDDPLVWRRASPISHASAKGGAGAFLTVTRGSSERIAAATLFHETLVAAGARSTLSIVSSISHEEVSQRLGAANDTVITPTVREFLQTCFR